VVGGIIYAVGGNDAGGHPLNTVEAYHPATNTWTPGLASMPTARSQFAMGVVNGVLYAAGGNTGVGFTDPGTLVSTLEAYNPATNTWTPGLASMLTASECTAAGVMNGLLYVTGGVQTGLPFPGIGNSVEAYDPVGNSWSIQNPMPDNQENHSAQIINGVLYSVGGWNGSFFMSTNQAGTLN
jgi:N-acetylneuraminic acid mutarotase